MEESSIVYVIRTSENINIDLPQGASGSITYNTETGEIDININIIDGYDFSEIQILAHELLHGYQYLNGELDFSSDGKHPGLLYDKSDEYEAYERQNLFGKKVDSHTYVDEKYDTKIPSYPISYKSLPQGQKVVYIKLKKEGVVR